MTEINLNKTDLITRIQERINNPNTTIAGYLLHWLNDRYLKVVSRADWPFTKYATTSTLSFTTGGTGYMAALPSSFLDTIKIVTASGNILKYATQESVLQSDPLRSGTGASPTHYYYPVPGYIAIHPAPSEALSVTLYYYSHPTAIADDTSTILIPNEFRVQILVNGVTADYFRLRKEFDIANGYERDFEAGISELLKKEGVTDTKPDEDLRIEWRKSIPIRKNDDVQPN
jgi:hypothetical protein